MKRIALILAALIATLGFVWFRQQPVERFETEGRFDFRSGEWVRGLGVCQFKNEQMQCWTMKGEPTLWLAERMRSADNIFLDMYRETAAGRKTRFLVVEPRIHDVSYMVQTDTGGYVRTGHIGGKEGPIGWYRLDADPYQTTAGLLVTLLNVPDAKPGRLTPVRGAKLSYEGLSLTVHAVQNVTELPTAQLPFPAFDGNGPVKQNKWRLTLKGIPADKVGSYRVRAHGKDGARIQFCRKDGTPIAKEELMAMVEEMKAGIYRPLTSFMAQTVWSGASAYDDPYIVTTVNPKHIGWIEITRSKKQEVLLKGFPLEPK